MSKLARQRFEQRMYDVGKPFGPAPSAGIPDGAVRLVRKRDLRRRRSFELRRQRAAHSAGRGFRPQRIRKLMARSSVPGAGAPRLGLPDLGLGVGLCPVPKFGLLYGTIDVDPGNLAAACAPIVEQPAAEPPLLTLRSLTPRHAAAPPNSAPTAQPEPAARNGRTTRQSTPAHRRGRLVYEIECLTRRILNTLRAEGPTIAEAEEFHDQ